MPTPRELKVHLNAASGWLDLGNWSEANEELERLPAALRAAPQVLALRCRIYEQAGRWSDLEIIAKGASEMYPKHHRFQIHRAWALHRLGRTAEAEAIVGCLESTLPEKEGVAYSLACFNAALGHLDEARKWLSKAIERSADADKVKVKALHQQELEPLWRSKI